MNWEFDMTRKTAIHKNGLRVRFLMRNGDWKSSPIAPIPGSVNLAHLPYLLREANARFGAEWLKLRQGVLFLERESA